MHDDLHALSAMLLRMQEAVEGGLCLPEAREVMRCMLLRMLEVSEVLEAPEVMRCVLLRILDAVEVGSVCRRR